VTNPYDVIIIDGSDPVGPAEGLFKKQFYVDCYKALSENGVLTAQSESPFVEKYHDSIRSIVKATSETFSVAKLYSAFIPLYPTGFWCLTFASKGIDPHSDEVLSRVEEGLKTMGNSLNYYNKDIHIGAFALPNFVKQIIGV
jgi:spermidine synthase